MARSFNGTTDKIITSASGVLSPAAVSVSVWIKVSSRPAAYAGIVVKQTSGNVPVYILYLTGSGQMAYYVGATVLDPGANILTNSVWNHVCFSYSNATGHRPFVNGVSDFASGGTGTLANDTSKALSIGVDTLTANRFFNGSLANVGIWNVALTDAELKALFAGALPYSIRSGSLIGYWPLDGLQSPEPDLSGNAFNGTLTGTALASGPPVMMFTPRWPQVTPAAAAASAVVYRRSLSSLGTRAGSRQLQLGA